MPNLKTFRNRIRSIKSTQKITKAMQLVAASKFQKFKRKVENSKHYLAIIDKIMLNIVNSEALQDLSDINQKFFTTSHNDQNSLLIIFTSERGLCGSFNLSIIKKLKLDITNLQQQGKSFKIIVIGQKGYENLKIKYKEQIDSHFSSSKQNNDSMLAQIKNRILEIIKNDGVQDCYFYFNQLKNAMVQIPMKTKFLPIKMAENQLSSITENSSYKTNSQNIRQNSQNYQFEGNGLINEAINLYLDGQINATLLESFASEEGSRMNAMDNATNNAKDMIDKLTLELNRSRQAIITKDLVEIISGAESL